MKRILLIKMFLLICVFTYGQSSFSSGFIITNTGDTLNGQIKVKTPKKSMDYCLFKESGKGKPKRYTADELREVKFLEGKYYVSKKVLSNGQYQNEFLEILVDGIADLSLFKDTLGSHYLLQNGNDSLIELKNSKYEVIQNTKRYLKEKKEYLGVLKSTFNNAPQLASDIDNTGFFPDDLIKIVKEYHENVCDEYDCTIYKKRAKNALGVELWTTFADISFDPKTFALDFLNEEEFEPTTYLSGVVQYSGTNVIGLSERVTLNVGLGFHKVKFNSERFEINQNNLTLPVTINYAFPTGKLKPFLNLGFVNIFNVNTSLSSNLPALEHPENVYYQRFEETLGSFFQFEAIAGAGLKYSVNQMHYSLSLNYGLGSGVNPSGSTRNNEISSSVKDVAVRLGVFFDLKRKG